MKFCVALDHRQWTRGDPREAVEKSIALAERADEGGIDSLWLNEDPEGWDAFAVLGAIARETNRIRLGTGVTNPFHRHPNLIAASVSTLDRLSGCRAFLGIGRGQPEWYREALGVPAYPPLELLEETFDLLGQWWTAPHRASASGPIEVRNWERTIGPISRPPIYLAAVGPSALDLAGRRADGVLFNELASPHYLAEAIPWVKRAATSAGRDPDQLNFFVNPAVYVTDQPETMLESKKSLIAMVHVLPGMERLLESPGFDIPAIVEGVRKAMKTKEILARGGGFPDLRREGDLNAARAAIPTELVAHLSAVGPLLEVKRKLRQYEELGATHVFLDSRGLPNEPRGIQGLIDELNDRHGR